MTRIKDLPPLDPNGVYNPGGGFFYELKAFFLGDPIVDRGRPFAPVMRSIAVLAVAAAAMATSRIHSLAEYFAVNTGTVSSEQTVHDGADRIANPAEEVFHDDLMDRPPEYWTVRPEGFTFANDRLTQMCAEFSTAPDQRFCFHVSDGPAYGDARYNPQSVAGQPVLTENQVAIARELINQVNDRDGRPVQLTFE
ncbi:MAG: hypothetical protein AB7G06_02325 [Bdellovibrionales bacterium]